MSGTDWLRARAARWCSARTMERVIEPALADLQTECVAMAYHVRWAIAIARCLRSPLPG